MPECLLSSHEQLPKGSAVDVGVSLPAADTWLNVVEDSSKDLVKLIDPRSHHYESSFQRVGSHSLLCCKGATSPSQHAHGSHGWMYAAYGYMDGWMDEWLDALMHAQMYGLHGWMYAVGKRGSAHIWT